MERAVGIGPALPKTTRFEGLCLCQRPEFTYYFNDLYDQVFLQIAATSKLHIVFAKSVRSEQYILLINNTKYHWRN